MLIVPVFPLKVAPVTGAGSIVMFPLTFMVLLFMLNVPPVTIMLFGSNVLPALLVHKPPVLTSMSPPIVVLVP